MARPVWREAMGVPDALNGADRNAGGFRHHRAGPVRRLQGRVFKRQGDNPFGDLVSQRRDAGRPRLVAKQAVEAVLHEPFLPAPDAGLGLACRRMISFVPIPSALSKTISARQTCFCAALRSMMRAPDGGDQQTKR